MTPPRGVPTDGISGVMTVLPTPFDDDGAVDVDSLVSLVDHAIAEGSTGLVCFGLASELYKLSDAERTRILSVVLSQVAGRVPVIAGSESNSVETAVARTAEYCAAGVAAVMTLPPSFVKPDQGSVIEYYREVASAAAGAPVIVQDAPTWTGVPLPLDLLQRVRDVAPNVTHVKVENPPQYATITALSAAGFTCVGGYGALHILEDVEAGICGVMYGAGTIADMVQLWSKAHGGSDQAWTEFERILPLLAFQMSSLDVFVAVQKYLLATSGVIASAHVRRPGRPLTDHQVDWLEHILLRRLGRPS
ncbi:MAG: dihydrodipicolinate synthase family protein [Microcella sp.]|uniref:dihydrodipicolinate synthase family protein n=1 Tax=Microcella sp. TaxID=1913979 RepID=UPI003315FFD9